MPLTRGSVPYPTELGAPPLISEVLAKELSLKNETSEMATLAAIHCNTSLREMRVMSVLFMLGGRLKFTLTRFFDEVIGRPPREGHDCQSRIFVGVRGECRTVADNKIGYVPCLIPAIAD